MNLNLLLVNVFLVKKKLSFSIKIMQIEMVLQFEKVVQRKKKNEEIGRRNFFCHREGTQPLKMVDLSKKQRNRKSLKCGCKACLTIVLWKSIDIFPKEWHVTIFVIDHNHELLSPLSVRFLSANWVITKDDKNCILLYKEARLSIRKIIRVMKL